MSVRPDRRRFLARAAASAGALALGGCDRLTALPWFRSTLESAERLSLRAQRLLLGSGQLAKEYSEADLSPNFRANGSTDVDEETYQSWVDAKFETWRLAVEGLVEKPLSLSLAELQAMPSRTQITRHDCVEGWSCIGKWKGVPLGTVLDAATLKPGARYIVFRCADALEPSDDDSGRYYESIDLQDAYHPQTILAYDMNDKPLPIAHGAPLRLRVERQLGYKMAKFIVKIEVVDSFAHIGAGRGGFWEDRGYEWYAGI